MADWEKMLKAYKECIDPDGNCYHCPYHEYGHIDPEMCNRQVLDDVFELLKAQEPQTVSGWVSVKDRLPPSQDMVIVAINDASGDSPYRYSYFGWYMQDASCWIVDDEIRRGEVYAWMPLPEPPKEDYHG